MRYRTVKEGFWQSETLASVCKESRLLAIAILNYADDDGYFMDVPQVIKGALFPFDDYSGNSRGNVGEESWTVRSGLDDLSRIGYIRRGATHDGKRVCHIVNFLMHQKVEKPRPSKIAGLVAFWDEFPDVSPTFPRSLPDVSPPGVGVGVGVGVGQHPPKPPHADDVPAALNRITASDWIPMQEHRDLAAIRNADCDLQLSRFRERNNGQTDTDQGWSVRFRQWLGSSKPERSVSREAVASPTVEQWMEFARSVNNCGNLGKWPKESAEAGWLENQAKGWRYVTDWQADCQARAKRWAANEATQAQRRKS